MQLCVLSARLWNTLYNCCAIYWDSNLMMREMIFDVRKVFTFYWCITQIVLSSGTGNKCWPRATGFSSPYVKSVLENKNHFRDMNEIYPILSHWRNIQEDRRRKQTLQEHFLSSIVPPVGFFHDILFAPGIVEQNSRQSSLVLISQNRAISGPWLSDQSHDNQSHIQPKQTLSARKVLSISYQATVLAV